MRQGLAVWPGQKHPTPPGLSLPPRGLTIPGQLVPGLGLDPTLVPGQPCSGWSGPAAAGPFLEDPSRLSTCQPHTWGSSCSPTLRA